MTKRECFTEIAKLVTHDTVLMNFVENELVLLDKKNKSKSKAQLLAEQETANLTENITEMFVDNPNVIYTATEVATAHKVTVQKVTAILTNLVNDEIVKRTVVKGKANFQWA